MPRKKKVVKVVKKPKKIKAPKYAAPAAEVPQVIAVLAASLLDAFRQYVESRLKASQVASVEEFKAGFKYTLIAHNITNQQLIDSLEDYEQDYVKNANKVKTPVVPIVPVPKVPVAVPPPGTPEITPGESTKKDVKGVFDSLDLI